MKFLQKNSIYIILLFIMGVVFFVPGVKDFLKDKFFPVAEVESHLHISEADYDIQLKGINVPDTNLKNFRGKKLLFLNFWGTWCPPCRQEWPTIQKLYDSKKGNMDFVLVAMMDKEDAVRKFVEENKYTAPVYLANSPLSENLLPKVFPTTYILDKNGRILMKEDALKDWNNEQVHDFIDRLSK